MFYERIFVRDIIHFLQEEHFSPDFSKPLLVFMSEIADKLFICVLPNCIFFYIYTLEESSIQYVPMWE